MAKGSFTERLKTGYIRFKESPWAIGVTIGFCVLWITLHAVLHRFDVDFAWYQVILSTDASIVTTLFVTDAARQHAHRIRIERRQELELRAIQNLIKAQKVCPYAT